MNMAAYLIGAGIVNVIVYAIAYRQGFKIGQMTGVRTGATIGKAMATNAVPTHLYCPDSPNHKHVFVIKERYSPGPERRLLDGETYGECRHCGYQP